MAKILAVCRSDSKGTIKESIGQGFFEENFGLVDDAHSESNSHRQVSLLAIESIKQDAVHGPGTQTRRFC